MTFCTVDSVWEDFHSAKESEDRTNGDSSAFASVTAFRNFSVTRFFVIATVRMAGMIIYDQNVNFCSKEVPFGVTIVNKINGVKLLRILYFFESYEEITAKMKKSNNFSMGRDRQNIPTDRVNKLRV
jgi:hypothetical protein